MIEKGYYYHYKHDETKGWNDHMYEVLGTGWNTEAPGFKSADPTDFYETEMVVYRPLYEDSIAYQNNDRGFWLRPLKMWFDPVEWNGVQTTRFVKVTDSAIIELAHNQVKKLYSE